MSTVYTLNGKVLKNAANDKWLAKKEAPAGFVMNASNATYTLKGESYWVSWQGPVYPEGYNGNGKRYILVNNNSTSGSNPLLYDSGLAVGGPNALNPPELNVLGTSTGVLLNNGAGSQYGIYLTWPNPVEGYTLEQLQAYMTNVSITIVDP